MSGEKDAKKAAMSALLNAVAEGEWQIRLAYDWTNNELDKRVFKKIIDALYECERVGLLPKS